MDRIFHHDRLVPVGAQGDDGDRHLHQFGQETQVGHGLGRQFFELAALLGGAFPAGQGFKDRLAAGEVLGAAGEMLDALAIEFVGNTHLDLVELIEHVELGDRQAIEAVHLHRITANHTVKPAATAAPARGGAVFTAPVAEVVVEAALQLGGEGALAHPGGVGLGHADHPVDQGGADAGADAGPAGDRVGGGDVGVGAVVEVEQGALGALKQDVFAGPRCLVDRADAVDHVGGQALAVGGVFGDHRLAIEGFDPVDPLEQQVLLRQGAGEAVPQPVLIEQVDDADAVAFGLVGVGGTDTPAGGADAAIAPALLHRLIEQAVVGHGHVGRGGQLQALHADAVLGQHVQLAQHHARIHHGAGADQAGGIRIKDAGWNQVQLEHLVVHHDGVTGIHTALVAHDHIGRTTEEIGDLALPLVTPLSTDDDNVGQGHSGP